MADIKQIIFPRRENFTPQSSGTFARQILDFFEELSKRANGDSTESNDVTISAIANYLTGSINSLGAQLHNKDAQIADLDGRISQALSAVGLLNAELRDVRTQLSDIRNTFPWQ